jgi:hypothetical protein
MDNTVVHYDEVYRQLRKLQYMLIRETRNGEEVCLGKVMENCCFKDKDKRTILQLILGKEDEIKYSTLKCLKIMSSSRLITCISDIEV